MLIQAPSEFAALPAEPKAAIAPNLLIGTADFSALLQASQSGPVRSLIAPQPSDEPVFDVPVESAGSELAAINVAQDTADKPGKIVPESGNTLPVEMGVPVSLARITTQINPDPKPPIEPVQPARQDASPINPTVAAAEAKPSQTFTAATLPQAALFAPDHSPVLKPVSATTEVAAKEPRPVVSDVARTAPRSNDVRALHQAAPHPNMPTEDVHVSDNLRPAATPSIQTGQFDPADPVGKSRFAAFVQMIAPQTLEPTRNARDNTKPERAPRETAAPHPALFRSAAQEPRDLGSADRPTFAPSSSVAASELAQSAQSSENPKSNQAPTTITPTAPPMAETRMEVRSETRPEIRPDVRSAPQIEAAIDQMAQAREAGRTSRPELTLRHAEFGAVNVRLEAAGGDMRATLASRDPAFAPAIQAALAERGVAASSETSTGTSTNAGNSQRGHDQGSSQSNSHSAFSGGNSHSDGRYGSSTGSGQAQSQPYSEQNRSDDEEHISHDRSEPADPGSDASNANGLFA